MKTYPKIGEVFKLTLDGDAPENQPLAMVESCGFNSVEWNHKGKRATGRKTGRFKLVQVGCCRTRDELIQKLTLEGQIPEGQWLKAFMAEYPNPDGKGPVGIADASWEDWDGDFNLPYIRSDGHLDFESAFINFSESGRWLIRIPGQTVAVVLGRLSDFPTEPLLRW